jgi:hypothetical protein
MAQTASTPIWDTIWPELIKGLPAALVALVIGAIAACIAYRQYRVARDKFRLDLFDRRYAIFLATWRELSRVVTDGPPQQAFSEFQNHVPQARFLFGPEIEAYLQELMKNLTEPRLHRHRRGSPGRCGCPAGQRGGAVFAGTPFKRGLDGSLLRPRVGQADRGGGGAGCWNWVDGQTSSLEPQREAVDGGHD